MRRFLDRLVEIWAAVAMIGIMAFAAFILFCIITTWYVVVVQGAGPRPINLDHLNPPTEQPV